MRRKRNMQGDELVAWFWTMVEPENGDACRCWTGFRHDKGYGIFGIGPRLMLTHRFAYGAAVAPIPSGLQVLHRCDNPPCCNPEHLFLGTNADNMADKMRKSRQAKGDRSGARMHPEKVPRGDAHPFRRRPEIVPRGEAHPHARLTESQVIEIRASAANGETRRSLAERFGVARPTISGVLTRTTWAHVAAPPPSEK